MGSELLLKEIFLYVVQNILPIIMGLNIGTMVTRKRSLKRLSKYDGKIIIDKPPMINSIEEQEKQYIRNRAKRSGNHILSTTIEKLNENISEKNMEIFYYNLRTIKINRNLSFLLIGLGGSYSNITNHLKYTFTPFFNHEASHVASSTSNKLKGICCSGFRQSDKHTSIGTGINEGYTELFSARHLNNGKIRSYKTLVKIDKLIELLFQDKKELENLYLKCNLPGLINKLEKYTNKEKIIKLILDIDTINDYSNKFNPITITLSIKVQLELYKWFISKNPAIKDNKEFTDLLCKNIFIKIMFLCKNVLNTTKGFKSYSHKYRKILKQPPKEK